MKQPFLYCALFMLFTFNNLWGQWSEVPGIETAPINSSAVQNGVYFAASSYNLVYRSYDGRNWQIIPGLPTQDDYNYQVKVDGARVYIYGASTLDDGIDIYYTTDGGLSLTPIPIPAGTQNICFLGGRIFRLDNQNILYKSDNDGVTWEQVFSQALNNPIMDIRAWNGELRMVTAGAIFGSNDLGLNWTPIGAGSFGSASVLHAIGSTLYCYAATQAPLVSADGGASWSPIPDLANWFDYSGSGMIEFSGKIYAIHYKEIFESADNGVSWQRINVRGGSSFLVQGTDLLVFGDFGVLRSSDAINWFLSLKTSYGSTYDELREVYLFDAAIFVSTNRFRTFFTRNNGIDWQFLAETGYPQSVNIAPQTLIIPPYKLSAGSSTLTMFNYPVGVNDVIFTYGNGTLLAFNRSDYRMWKSLDEGDTWTEIIYTPTFTQYPYDFAFAGGRFFITFPNQVYTSSDGGETWSSFIQGVTNFPTSNVIDLQVAGDDIFLNTYGITYRFYTAGWEPWGLDFMHFAGGNGRFFGWNFSPQQITIYDEDGIAQTNILPSNMLLKPEFGLTYTNEVLFAVGQSSNAPGGLSVWTLDFSGIQNSPVSGRVYLDANSNNVQDSGEQDIVQNPVTLTPNNFTSLTDGFGAYNFMLWQSGDVLKPTLPSVWYQSVPPQITVTSTGAGNDFAIQPIAPTIDLAINATAYSVFRPGFQTNINLTISNPGTVAQGGSVNVTLPGFMSLVSASPAPGSSSGNTHEWTLASLGLLDQTSITLTVLVDASATLGAPAGIQTSVTASGTDVETTNNFSPVNDILVGSFDPNDKTVSPENVSPQQLTDGQELTYKIRFQNTGSYPATFIKILDTLHNHLDVSTLKVISASHPMRFKVLQGHILEFFFDDINLPDSISNEPGSHGFVLFSMRPKSNLPLGTAIPNRAGIYFDFNEPVITNYATMTVKNDVSSTGLLNENTFSTAPNPTSDWVSVRWQEQLPEGCRLFIYDVAGQQLRQIDLPTDRNELQISLGDLPAGLYFMRFASIQQGWHLIPLIRL